MYADPFTCTNDANTGGTLSYTFDLITFPNVSSGSLRKNATTDAGTIPEWLKISHQTVGKGDLTRDRHLVRFEQSSVDGSNIGTHLPSVAYVVFDIPRAFRSSTSPTVLARALCGFLRSVDAEASAPDYTLNFGKLLNGEM